MKNSKRLYIIILVSCLFIFLSGCRVDLFSEEASDSPFIKETGGEEKVQLDASVNLRTKSLLIRSRTTFPPGTVFDVELKEYPQEATAFNVETFSIEPKEKSVLASTMTVQEDGSVDAIVMKRPDFNTRYRLQITFNPTTQTEEVRETLGENGENMANDTGIEEMEIDNRKTYIYRKYVNIMKRDEPFGFLGEMDFLIDERDQKTA